MKWFRRREPVTESSVSAEDYAQVLLDLGFDHARYVRDYPVLADLSPAELARHYHLSGRAERLTAGFSISLPEGQARIDAQRLSETDKDLLRLDIAAAASRDADMWGRDPRRTAELLAPSAAHRPLLVVSDSHGMLYLTEDVLRSGRLLPTPFLCTGASARGLGNPASRAQAGERIRNHLRTWREQLDGAVLLLKFGQVDLEFVHDYRRIRDGRPPFDLGAALEFAQESAGRFVAFAREVSDLTPARVVVTAALPPSLSDAALREGYLNAHIAELHAELNPEELRRELQRLDMPDWRTRTDLARSYNETVASECRAMRLTFYDDFTPLLGPEGVIHPDLIVWHGGTDHHLCATSPAARQAVGGFARDLAAL